METTAETTPTSAPGSLNAITAPEAARNVSLSLHAAAARARTLPASEGADAMIEIAREWRHLALALAQHQAMSPRPKADER